MPGGQAAGFKKLSRESFLVDTVDLSQLNCGALKWNPIFKLEDLEIKIHQGSVEEVQGEGLKHLLF